MLACLQLSFSKRKKVPSGRLHEPRLRVAVYLCLPRQPPGTGRRNEQAGKERGLAGGFREVPELTGAWRGPGPLHAWALTHCRVPGTAGGTASGPQPPVWTPTPLVLGLPLRAAPAVVVTRS